MDGAGQRLEAAALDEEAVSAWGRRIAAEAALPLFLCLRGPLGVGKSVLARAIARGCGVSGALPSPTFNLVFWYAGERPDGPVEIAHLDLYRLDDPEEVWELGWRELGEGRQIVLVEWPDRAEALLPEHRWEVRLEPVADDPLSRRVRAEPVGEVGALPAPGGEGPRE